MSAHLPSSPTAAHRLAHRVARRPDRPVACPVAAPAPRPATPWAGRSTAALASLATAALLASTAPAARAAVIVGTYTFGADGFTGAGVSGGPQGSLRGQLTVQMRDDAQALAGFSAGSSFALPANPRDALLAFEASFTGAGTLVPAVHFELDEVQSIVIADDGTFARQPPALAAVPARFTVIAQDRDTGVDLNFFLTAIVRPPFAELIGPQPIRPGLESPAPFAVLGLVAPDPPDPPGPPGRVPEPGSLWLALAAALALAAQRRPRVSCVHARHLR